MRSQKVAKRLPVKKYFIIQVVLLFFGFYLISPHSPMAHKNNRLEGLFYWAKKYYLEGMYRQSATKLKNLLTYLNKDHKQLNQRVSLLLGAAYEKMGKFEQAKKYYRKAIKDGAVPFIEEIDFGALKEYNHIVLGKDKVSLVRIIEKESSEPRKKKTPSLLLIAGALVVVTGIVYMVLKSVRKSNQVYTPPELIPDFDTNELGIEWVKIPAGQYYMGDSYNEGEPDEQPVHLVSLKEYYISKYEITCEQYGLYCGEMSIPLPDDSGWGRGQRPIINVTRTNAVNFCSWLSGKTGKAIFLPTEAQWEFAARGEDQRRYPWGNTSPNCNLTNYNCYGQTFPVGSFSGVSPFGIHDLAGNVAEWCKDRYDPDYYSSSPMKDPQGPEYWFDTNLYVVRGGSWDPQTQPTIRSDDRCGVPFTSKSPCIGFRIVRELKSY
jgi:formylglycine-generating enzyme required for sulfatase activity